jgi:predicted CXXCH cytochrome family protein
MAVVVGCLVALTAVAQWPNEHPSIPELEGGGVDFTACSVCHSDKTEAPTVHAAVELGCEGCHDVDQDEDWTEIFLPTEGNELCLTCHTEMQPDPSVLTVHQPVRRDNCITCHDPHTSETDSLLRLSTEGLAAEDNLCLGCHEDILSQIQKENQHAAMEFGCSSCHSTHKNDPQVTPEGVFHLVEAQPDLCVTCHDTEDDAFRGSHSNQPVAKAECTLCHNPHGSDNAKLINNTVHGAFEMGCETCHEEPSGDAVVLQEGAGRETCLMCHAEVEEQMGEAQIVHFPLEMDSGCVTCHNPHATTSAKLLKRGPVATCFECHTELAEARAGKKHLHRPVFETSCTVCHQPHTGERERLLRADVNDLCLACHGRQNEWVLSPRTRPQRGRNKRPTSVELFGGAVELAGNALEGIKLLPVQPGDMWNHPKPGHPFGGEHEVNERTVRISCLSCHEPHAADTSSKFYVGTDDDDVDLCLTCH